MKRVYGCERLCDQDESKRAFMCLFVEAEKREGGEERKKVFLFLTTFTREGKSVLGRTM